MNGAIVLEWGGGVRECFTGCLPDAGFGEFLEFKAAWLAGWLGGGLMGRAARRLGGKMVRGRIWLLQ